MVGLLVGCCGVNGSSRQKFSLLRAVSQKEGEVKRNDRRETNTKHPLPAALTSAVCTRPTSSKLLGFGCELFSVPESDCNHPRSFVFQIWFRFFIGKSEFKMLYKHKDNCQDDVTQNTICLDACFIRTLTRCNIFRFSANDAVYGVRKTKKVQKIHSLHDILFKH